MWFATRWTTRSRTARGERSRSRNSPASSAPTASWRRKWPSAKVDGLPMSWTSAASRTTGRPAGAASTDRSVWSQRSSPSTLFCGTPRWAASASSIPASSPVSASSRSPIDGVSAAEQLVELGRDPLAREVPDQLGLRLDAGQRRRLDVEPERRRQPHGPDHPEGVLLEALPRIADGAQDVRPGVGRAVVRVHEPGRTGGRGHAPPTPSRCRSGRGGRGPTSMVSPNSTRCGRRKSA